VSKGGEDFSSGGRSSGENGRGRGKERGDCRGGRGELGVKEGYSIEK